MIFEGSGVALITPFDKNGEVNYYSLKKLIEFQIACGTKAIIILGTTGESATISKDERKKIINFCVCLVGKRIPVIVGTGSNSTKTAKENSIEAENLGADALLVVTPYYNKCNQQGIFNYYKTISNAVKLPIIAYNVPSRTGVNIEPQTVLKLSKIKNVVGIKEASGNLKQIAEILKIVPTNFSVFSGDDFLTLPIMLLGGKGVISVTANVYPELIQNMCDFALKNDYFNAKRISKYMQKINECLFLDVNPICIKEYMNLIGFNVGDVRPPLCKPSSEILKKLKEVKHEYEN